MIGTASSLASSRSPPMCAGSREWKAGCRNWYMTERGKITNNWPRSTFAWRKRTRALDLGDFELLPAA